MIKIKFANSKVILEKLLRQN